MFRPERFMEAEREGHRIEMEKQVELAFGYGRWMCAGKPVAMMELSKVFFEVSFDCYTFCHVLRYLFLCCEAASVF